MEQFYDKLSNFQCRLKFESSQFYLKILKFRLPFAILMFALHFSNLKLGQLTIVIHIHTLAFVVIRGLSFLLETTG